MKQEKKKKKNEKEEEKKKKLVYNFQFSKHFGKFISFYLYNNLGKQVQQSHCAENLINNQSEKEMEIFIHVNLRIITQESSQKALRTVLVRQVGKLVCL